MYIYRLTHALADAGHEVDVIHCVDSYHLLHPTEPEIRFDEHPNVRTHRLQSGYGWLSPLLTQQTGRPMLKGRAIREVLGSRSFDVLHFHNISLLGPRILTVEPEAARAVKIYTTHEHWLICPTHVLWKFNSRPCEKPECFRCTLQAKRPPQLWRYTNLLAESSKSVDQFVAPSRFTARMHAERGFSQPVAHLPYFIERADRDWQEPGPRPQERPYFLFVGRLETIKGLHTLIALWEKTPEYDLLVVGEGTEGQRLRAQASGNPRIKFLGGLPQRELGLLYFHAVACLVPSITYETFGVIMIEAFARQTPVIARDLGALPEIIQDSGGGIVYRNDEELIAAMRQLATSPELRTELGGRGYRAFVQLWSKEAHLQLYFNYLRDAAIMKFGSAPWEA